MSDLIPSSPPPGGEFLFYQTEDGRTRRQVRMDAETVWLSSPTSKPPSNSSPPSKKI